VTDGTLPQRIIAGLAHAWLEAEAAISRFLAACRKKPGRTLESDENCASRDVIATSRRKGARWEE